MCVLIVCAAMRARARMRMMGTTAINRYATISRLRKLHNNWFRQRVQKRYSR